MEKNHGKQSLSGYLLVFISICYIYVENNAVDRGVKPLFTRICVCVCVCVCVCMGLKANQRSDDYMKALTLLTIVDRELFSRISCNLQAGKQ